MIGKVIISIIIFIALSCSNRSNNILIVKHGHEKIPFDDLKGFELVKKVELFQTGVVIDRWDKNDKDKNIETIIAIRRTEGESFIIPFPSNEEKHYWGFENDSIDRASQFSVQLDKAIDGLDLGPENSRMILSEIFENVLCYNKISVQDSNSIPVVQFSNNAPNYNYDSCMVYSDRILNMIKKKLSENIVMSTFLHDEDNGRIFNFEFVSRDAYKLRIYRIGCEMQMLSL